MRTIAVVDDNARLLETVGAMLDGAGYAVSLYESPVTALKAFHDAPVDLVISDIYMPGMNGFQFIEELRTILPDVPVIAISGGGRFSGENVLENAEEFGATATLAKPLRRAELLALIDKMLSS
jgi:CheY-like chemotaxis protein